MKSLTFLRNLMKKMMKTINPKEIDMLQKLSLAIAATQVRTFIEVNCQVVRLEGNAVQYDLTKEDTHINDEELTEHFNGAIRQYTAWIEALTQTMNVDEAIETIGYWPVLADNKISFQGARQ